MSKFTIHFAIVFVTIIPNVIGFEVLPANAEEFLEGYKPLASTIKQLLADCWYLSEKDDEDQQGREVKDCMQNRVKNDAELLAVETKYRALKEALTDEQLEELEGRMTRLLNEEGV